MALKLRRGTNAERLTITPESGELIYVTDNKKLYVGDGSTLGGTVVSGLVDVVDDTSPSLGGDLDLNGNNITGTGNINITGTITATGNINLGDGAGGDVISVGGVVSGALVPDEDIVHDIGSGSLRWRNAWFSSISAAGQITADSIQADLIADDSSVAYDNLTNTFNGNFSGSLTGDVTGDVTGSIFGDDSSPLVDSVASEIVGKINTSQDANYNGNNILNVSFMIDQRDSADFTLRAQPVGEGGLADIRLRPSGQTYMRLRTRPIDGETDPLNGAISINGSASDGNVYIGASASETQSVFLFNMVAQGDITGSVFGDDSTTIVDAVNNTVIGTLVATAGTTPSASGDPGAAGEIRFDDDYIYIKTSAGWKRSALSTL